MSQIKEEKAHTQAMLSLKKKQDVENEDPRVRQTCKQWQMRERQKSNGLIWKWGTHTRLRHHLSIPSQYRRGGP